MKKKTRLCIYCFGGIGREIFSIVQNFTLYPWRDVLFIDDNPSLRTKYCGHKVITFKEYLTYYQKTDFFDEFLVTCGEPLTRKKLYEKIVQHDIQVTSFFYPQFIRYLNTEVGFGTIINQGTLITCDVKIGYGCLINKQAIIAHDVSIDDYCVISPNVTIGGNVHIGKHTFIGSGAIIRNNISIGNNCIIGMGSVVLNSIHDDSIIVGNPAKFLKKNDGGKIF